MDQSQKQSSSESENSLDSGTQGSLDQTTDSLEGISDLNKRLESSLFISKKPESKSTDAQANEQCNISQSSDFKESGPEILSRQSSLKETQSSSYESSSRSVQTPESTKIVDDKPSSAIKETVNPKQDVVMQRPHPYSRERPEGKVLPNTQYFSSTDPKLYPPGYHCNVNPAFLPRSVNPVQNQAFAYPGQYPEQSLMDPNIAYRQDINQWQVPPTNIRMAARPVVLFSRSRKTSYYHNPMPPIRTNATPMRCGQGSSYKNPMPPIKTNATHMRCGQGSSYKNSMPPIKTNATLIRYVQRSSRYQNPMIPVRMNATSMRHIQPPRPTTSNVPRRMNYSPDVVQSRQDLTPGEFLKLPAKQPQKSTPTAIDNRNISTPNPRQPKKLTKLEELAKRVHYSKKNMLNIDIPTEDPTANYFPLYATPQGGIALRQVQRTPIQFPTPSGSGYFGSTFAAVRGTIPNLPYQTVRSCAQSNVYSHFHPEVADQAVSRPAIQDNILIQSISNAGNPMQPVIQEQIMTPQTVQYQPAIENLTAAPQYQDPNHLMYQYGTQYQPAMQNLTMEFQHQDPYHAMYQHGTQYQPAMQNLTMEFQHQDPYHAMYQHGTQYQPAMQNLTMEFQHQDPYHAMYQHGTHISSETFRPPDTPWSYPTYDASIPSQQYNSSILPMQTFSTNPSSTSMIQDDPNLVPNISGVQTSVENSSSISMSQYPPGFYATNESTSHIWIEDPSHGSNHYQGSVSMNNPDVMHANMYTEWAVSTGDPHEDTPIDEREETSKNQ